MARAAKKSLTDVFNPTAAFVAGNQLYVDQSSLKLWYQFPQDDIRTDDSGNGETGAKIGTVIFDNDTPNLFTQRVGSAKFDPGSYMSIPIDIEDVINASSGLTFSFWVKRNAIDSGNVLYLWNFGSTESIALKITTTGALKFDDSTWDGSSTETVYSLGDSSSLGKWQHIVVTLDRTGPNLPKVYLDGQILSATVNSSPAGSLVGISGNRFVGAGYTTQTTVKISNFAIWSSVLDSNAINAIYNSSRGTYEPISGFLSNPARILLQERDNKTGSYPTIARTGDPDFSGNYSVYYDDTNTINFVGNSATVYPTALPNVSKWVSGGIATPNILQGLITVGTASKGVADSQVSFTPGQNISPFNESRIYIDSDSTFYRTGTSKTTLPDFDQKLSSKTILTFDINPTRSTNVFFSTGSATTSYSDSSVGYASGVNSGMVYFNWGSKVWEPIGNFTTGSNVDILNDNPTIRSAAIHPACGLTEYPQASPISNTARHMGIFHSTHGFPFATQYNSTGSQELSLSGTLAGPFLLEKAVLEWSGSFASYPSETLADGPLCYQFFLMNVAPVSDSVTIVQDLTGSISGLAGTFTTRNANFNVTQVKDVVWSGIVARYYSGLTGSVPPLTYERDLNLVKLSANGTGLSAVTGSYRLEATAGIYGKNDGLSTLSLRSRTNNVPLLANKIGFRNFGGYVEGKSFVRPIAGINPSGSFDAYRDSSLKYKISSMPSSDVRRDSPYVLLPGHKLVLGFYGAPIQGNGTATTSDDTWSEKSARNHVTTLSPGAGRLTLYGSLLRDGKPVDPESNQPLNSDAIHEDIHYDNPVYDQFDVEPFEALTNSYIDLIITGSMLATPIGDPTAANVRKVQGSVAAGQAGTTGSLQRFVNLTSESDLYYDSLIPNPVDLYKRSGGTDPATFLLVGDALVFENPSTSPSVRTARNYGRSFPFEPKFEGVQRLTGIQSLQSLSGSLADAFIGLAVYGSSDILDFKFYQNVDSDDTTLLPITVEQVVQVFFGAGDYAGFPDIQIALASTKAGKPKRDSIRAFRYGLSNYVKQNTSSRFRRDRYGQYRDMLEQSPNAAFLVSNSVEYPVEIQFYSRPSKDGKGRLPLKNPADSHSQNLSSFATSSLPYFDGVARERTDNPDLTVADVSI